MNTGNLLQPKTTSMSDDRIVVDPSLDEQHLQNDNQDGKHLTENQVKLPSFKKEIQMTKKRPMQPTRLYVSLCFLLRHQ